MVNEGYPFVLVPLFIASVLRYLGCGCCSVFNAHLSSWDTSSAIRQRTIPMNEGLKFSAADGRVMTE
jgi:hypothetical protein